LRFRPAVAAAERSVSSVEGVQVRSAIPRRVLVLIVSLPPITGGCAAFEEIGADRMSLVATEQLCAWQWNPVSGWQMRRELARRGEACDTEAAPPTDLAATEGRAAPGPTPAPRPPDTVDLSGAPSPQEPAESVLPPPGERPVAAPPATTAPLVTPACAERVIRRGGGGGDGASSGPAGRAVAFRNRCAYPIRVLYASRRDGALSSLTGMIPPGELSAESPVEDGFDHPGYVVCSYATAPPDAPCRLGRGGAGNAPAPG
jgi:hypothetical protein